MTCLVYVNPHIGRTLEAQTLSERNTRSTTRPGNFIALLSAHRGDGYLEYARRSRDTSKSDGARINDRISSFPRRHHYDPHRFSHGNPPELVIIAPTGRGAEKALVGLSDKSCLFLSPRAVIVQKCVDQVSISRVS